MIRDNLHSNNFRNLINPPKGDTGYGYVKCEVETSLSDFISPNECETKTPQKPQISKRSQKDRGSHKGEIPLSNPSPFASPKCEVPLSWAQLVHRIKSGKDRITTKILGLITRNNGRIAHKVIAKALNLDRSTITKRINNLERLGILRRIPSRPRKYEVDSRFYEMLNGEISPFDGTPIPPADNGYFRVHGFQRVFLMVNFHIENVNIPSLKSDLSKKYGWRLIKTVKRRGWESYIFTHTDYPELKIELTKRTIIVSPASKNSFIVSFDKFPEDPTKFKQKLIEHIQKVAENFAYALGSLINVSIKIIDRGWAGENPISPKAKKKEHKRINKPEVSYIDPEGIIHEAEEKFGKFYIEGLGWFIDKSLKTEAELEFENDETEDSIDKSSKFKRMVEALNDHEVLEGLKRLGSVNDGVSSELKSMITHLHTRIDQLETLVNADLQQSQKFYRMFTFFVSLLDRVLALFGEIGGKQNQNYNPALVQEIMSAMDDIFGKSGWRVEDG